MIGETKRQTVVDQFWPSFNNIYSQTDLSFPKEGFIRVFHDSKEGNPFTMMFLNTF